jgi:hypothetical protein
MEKEIRNTELEETIERLNWVLNKSKAQIKAEIRRAIRIIEEFGIEK